MYANKYTYIDRDVYLDPEYCRLTLLHPIRIPLYLDLDPVKI